MLIPEPPTWRASERGQVLAFSSLALYLPHVRAKDPTRITTGLACGTLDCNNNGVPDHEENKNSRKE